MACGTVAFRLLAGLVLALALGAAGAPRVADAQSIHLFGTQEIPGTDLSAFHKWNDMLARHEAERDRLEPACASGDATACALRDWQSLLGKLRNRHPREQIAAVNLLVNRRDYVPDTSNYGETDYWATPAQFLTNRGDCEDFAIIKYMSLRTLGFRSDQLRVVVVEDVGAGAPHAVLVVLMDDEALVLDNRTAEVVPHERLMNYRPYYSLNEKGWWLHQS